MHSRDFETRLGYIVLNYKHGGIALTDKERDLIFDAADAIDEESKKFSILGYRWTRFVNRAIEKLEPRGSHLKMNTKPARGRHPSDHTVKTRRAQMHVVNSCKTCHPHSQAAHCGRCKNAPPVDYDTKNWDYHPDSEDE